MSKRYQSSLVICPYYLGQINNVIYCEGMEQDSSIHLAFGNPAKLRTFQENHCNLWEYACSGCLIAKGLEEKWDKETPAVSLPGKSCGHSVRKPENALG